VPLPEIDTEPLAEAYEAVEFTPEAEGGGASLMRPSPLARAPNASESIMLSLRLVCKAIYLASGGGKWQGSAALV
jgi:hypothetical protein